MGTFKTTYSKIDVNGEPIDIIDNAQFASFNESILGLGKIDSVSTRLSALSVMFDLEGFTKFCNQIDPQLAVPEYLSEFLRWMFETIKAESTIKHHENGYETWFDLPFLSKYLGDGILFLWDTKNMTDIEISNTVVTMLEICKNYQTDFFPKISKKITDAPPALRCGIARGDVFSVGDGKDYVGPCINVASRLQKLNSLTVCFSRRGLNPENFSDLYQKKFVVKRVNIRGIGPNELICVLKDEYESLTPEEKKNFSEI